MAETPYSSKEKSRKGKAATNTQDTTMEFESPVSTPTTTEKLEEIDLSVIAQPSIKSVKRKTKLDKEKEIIEETETSTHPSRDDQSKEVTKGKLPSDKAEEVKSKRTSTEKHIALMEGKNSYDISDDLNNKLANISITQLLDISPKLRSELVKLLKLKDSNTQGQSLNEIVLSTISRSNIAITKCYVYGIEGIAFLDTCASLNLVTKNYLTRIKEKQNLVPMGYTNNNIVQIFSEKKLDSELYLLDVKIGDTTIKDVFRVVENDKNIFDILIGFNTLKDNKLFVHPIDNHLCKMLSEESWDRVSPLGTDEEVSKESGDTEHHNLVNKVKDENYHDEIDQIEEVKDGKLKKQELLNKVLDELPRKYRRKVNSLFHEFIIILAIKIDELQPTKLLPHTIQLIENAKPIKRKGYRLSKVQTQALKQEITNLFLRPMVLVTKVLSRHTTA